MTVRITALRQAIRDQIVQSYIEAHYVLDHSKPTCNQLINEVMDEIEPAILSIKDALDKRRPNLNL